MSTWCCKTPSQAKTLFYLPVASSGLVPSVCEAGSWVSLCPFWDVALSGLANAVRLTFSPSLVACVVRAARLPAEPPCCPHPRERGLGLYVPGFQCFLSMPRPGVCMFVDGLIIRRQGFITLAWRTCILLLHVDLFSSGHCFNFCSVLCSVVFSTGRVG